jgi:hypothetical protein
VVKSGENIEEGVIPLTTACHCPHAAGRISPLRGVTGAGSPDLFRFSLILIIWLIQALGGTASRAESDLLAMVPDDVLFALHIRDIPGLREAGRDSPLEKFWKDPRTGLLLKPLRKKLARFNDRIISGYDTDLPGLENFFNGAGLVACLPLPGDQELLFEWVVILEHNGDKSMTRYFRERSIRRNMDLNRVTLTESGCAFTRMTLTPQASTSPGQDGASAGRIEYDQYFGEGFMVFAGVRGEPIRKILERIHSKSPLNPVAKGLNNINESPSNAGPGSLSLHLDLYRLFTRYKKDSQENWMNQGFNIHGLGLESFRGLKLQAVLNSGQLAVNIMLTSTGEKRGLGKLLFLPDKPVESAAHLVPSSVDYYSATSYPVMDAWSVLKETIQHTLPAIFPALEGQLRSIEEDSGIQIQNDLLSHVTGRTVRVRFHGGKPDRVPSQDIHMIELRNPGQFYKSLRSIFDLGSRLTNAYHLEWSESTRGKFWMMRAGRSGVAVLGRPLFYGHHADNWLICGASGAEIAKIVNLTGQENPGGLAGHETFQSIMKQMPASRHWEGYIKMDLLMRKLDGRIFKGNAEHSVEGNSPALGILNTSRQPDRKLWESYFGPVGLSSRIRNNNMEIRIVMIWP